MIKTKEAELTSAVLMYAIRCIAEGDFAALRQMQVGDEEIEAMKRIGIRDLYHAGSLRSHCVSIELNREIFWSMLRYMKDQSKVDDHVQELIELDAPFEMLREFCGMSTREYTRRRRERGDLTNAGRPHEPTDEEADQLWDAWHAVEDKDANGRLPGIQSYVSLSESLNIPMRSIWLLTERWIENERELGRSRSD